MHLLDLVRERQASFEGAARRAEEERTLPADIVALLCELRLFWLKTPVELGGSELDPLDFCEVMEELAYFDASAAWTAMVGNGTTGTVAGWLPEEGLHEVFPGTELPICAGQFGRAHGTAVPVTGGYAVTGRWSFCSGINHSGWLVGACAVVGRAGQEVLFVVPKSEAALHDTWYAAGLQGTGSGDFSLTDAFVPEHRTFDWLGSPPVRGGVLFRQPQILFVSNELSPLAVGIARRAIDDMYGLAGGHNRPVPLSERVAFQKDIGRAECRLRAVQVLYRDAVEQTWVAALAGAPMPEGQISEVRAQHTYVVEECLDLVGRIFRYGGGRVLSLSHPMQRHLRNLTAAAQHIYISDESYELAARSRLASSAAEVRG